MKLINKRYIYAGILGGLIFTIFLLIFNLDIIFSLILAIIGYLAGILLFKEKDIIIYDPKLIMQYSFEASKLLNYTNHTDDDNLREDIKEICMISEKLLGILEQKQNKVTQVYHFFDYYLKLGLKIMAQYRELNQKENLNDKENISLKNIPSYIRDIRKQFEKQLENMYHTKMLDMDAEIKLFKKMVPMNDISGEGEL